MAKYVLETGWRVVTNFFFVVGVVWSVGSLTKKVQSFNYLVSAIPAITARPMSLSFSLAFIRRPLVDIVVFCISVILFFSFKLRHRPRRAPREQSQKAEKVFDGRPKQQPSPLLTYHHPQETSEFCPSPEALPSERNLATHPRRPIETISPRVEDRPPPETKKHKDPPTSNLNLATHPRRPIETISPRVEDRPPPETKKHKDPPTSNFSPVRRSPNRNKPAGVAESPDRRTVFSPPANKSPRPLLPAATAVPIHQPTPQPRRFPDRQRPAESDAPRPRQNGGSGGATWTLERQAALLPSTRKPVRHFRDELAFPRDELPVPVFARASAIAGIPAASAPPWLGSNEDDDSEAHESIEETWRAITGDRLLKKSETWSTTRGHVPESSSEGTRMKKSETFNEWSPSRALQQRDRSIGAEELKQRADEYIAKMRNDLWLQRQESEERYEEMINRSIR
ncbi:hypothetical protein EJ110_NYTH50412 [Nymphaea thermarum]|nr:hypothetical protein EJ110_NYTH50412 [Nymphaea thermarum]